MSDNPWHPILGYLLRKLKFVFPPPVEGIVAAGSVAMHPCFRLHR